MIARDDATEQTNWSGTITYTPAAVAVPGSLQALQAAVRQAQGRQVRPRGSGHSWNAAISTDGVSIDTSGLSAGEASDGRDVRVSTVTGADGRVYRRFSVPAGMVQGDLAELAWKHGAPLPTQGPAPDITLSGFVANGCHGTGWSEPTIAELVVGLELVGPNGDVLVFDGETVPAGFEGLGLTAGELLNTVRVNLGALGVLARVVLQVPAEPFNVRVNNLFVQLTDVFDPEDPSKLERLLEGHEYVEIFWFPYNRYKMKGLKPVPLGPAQDLLWVITFDRTQDPVRVPGKFAALWSDAFGVLAEAGEWIGPLIDRVPGAVPAMSGFALKTMKWKNAFSEPVVMTPPNAFLYQRRYFRSFLDLEFTIPMRAAQGFVDVNAAFQQLVDRMEQWRGGAEGDMPYPINLNVHARFVRNSQALLSPAYAAAGSTQHTCYIEYLSYSHGSLTGDYVAFNRDFYDPANGLGWKRWGGLPNWGKYLESVPEVHAYVHGILAAPMRDGSPSRLARFLAVKEHIDPGGRTFTNAYLRGFFTGVAAPAVPLRGAPGATHVPLPAEPARRAFVGVAAPDEGTRTRGALELHHDPEADAAYLRSEAGEVHVLAVAHDPATGTVEYTVATPSQRLTAEEVLDRVAMFYAAPAV